MFGSQLQVLGEVLIDVVCMRGTFAGLIPELTQMLDATKKATAAPTLMIKKSRSMRFPSFSRLHVKARAYACERLHRREWVSVSAYRCVDVAGRINAHLGCRFLNSGRHAGE